MSASFAAHSGTGAHERPPRSDAEGLAAHAPAVHAGPGSRTGTVADGLRILLVDDDELILESMGIFLDTGLPRACVTKYHTLDRGRPGDDFDWSAYDVLLIDYNLGRGDTAFQWLDDYARQPGFPPTVLLLASEDPAVMDAARGRGVGACLNKTRLNPEELVDSVNSVLYTGPARAAGLHAASTVQHVAAGTAPTGRRSTDGDAGAVAPRRPREEAHAETMVLPVLRAAAPAAQGPAEHDAGAAEPPADGAHAETMILPVAGAGVRAGRSPVQDDARPEAPKALRILLVDDEELILDTLEIFLQSGFPDAEVTKYHTLSRGRPGEDFDWSAFDVLLLDFNLGNGDTAVSWLDTYAGRPGFPRTLLLTGSSDPIVVGRAVSSGADAYLNKTRLDPRELTTTVKDLLVRETAAAPRPAPPRDAGDTALGRGYLDVGNGRGRYRFVRLIGRGAMARVYLAERDTDRQTAVVKILDRHVAREPENVRRFTLEGELLASIDSPYVATIFDHGTSNGLGYIAMEFFGRGDLAQRMSRGVSPREAVLYLHNIACGLQEVHRKGIVHRDLKPANIMFRGDGSMALADFGIAKPIDSEVSLTASGVILGTPYCMSPEQTEGRDADVRSDLYAAGVLYYEMLTGERPFNSPSLPALLLAIQTEPVPRLEPALASHQPVLDRLLAKRPKDRFQSAGELIDALLTLPDAS